MSSPRRSQLRIAYPGDFAVQGSFGTGLVNGDIDTLFNVVGNPTLEFVTKDDRVIDCTGQFLIDEVLLSKSCRLQFQIEADAGDLYGIAGWFLGQVGASVQMLGSSEFQPPATTFIIGFDDPAGTKLKLIDMVGDELTISGRVAERIQATLSFRGNGSPASAAGYSFPDCSTPTPIRLIDGDFLLDGVSRIDDLRSIEFRYSNALLFNDDPFISSSVDVQRMERADQRPVTLNYTIFGQWGDSDHLDMINHSKLDWTWQIGPSSDGIEIVAASAVIRQGSSPGFDGEANRSVLNGQAEPVKISGNDDTPIVINRLT